MMSQAQALTGDAHKRFALVATLLSLIDPARGEPTVHSLDRHPHDSAWKLEHLQKKFLDSFALVCSTSSQGSETASAVCLEQDHPTGTVLRLARNIDVPQDLVDRLQHILNGLAAVASKGSPTKDKESEILYRIIDLVRDKVRSLLKRLNDPDIHKVIKRSMREMRENSSFLEGARGTNFEHWIDNLPVLASLEPDTETARLIPHIKWASQARWVYSEQIEALFCSGEQELLPPWFNNIYKLGRYFAAAKAMLKLTTRQPTLFTSIHVEVVETPERQRFSMMNDRTALKTVLQRLTKTDHQKLMEQLGKFWLTEDPASRFLKACHLNLTVHAEMQLLSFYDHHPELTPRLLFMGTSKKTCFLCHKFMTRHPLTMSASASHQKLYPSWMPAPCSISSVRKDYKVLLWELSRHLEQTTARDLESRLGVLRPRSLDSTAGPSLTTMESMASGWWHGELPIRSVQHDALARQVIDGSGFEPS